jgi:hypothetical protein
VLCSFFDDSGKESDPSHSHVIMAGLLANHWTVFDLHWQALLLKYEIPQLHLREAINLAKGKGWDHSKLNAVLNEFAILIREASVIACGIGVDMEAWRALPSSTRNSLGGDAQVFCCARMVRRIIDRLNNSSLRYERVTLIFDQDFELARYRLRLFEEIKKYASALRKYHSLIAAHFIPCRQRTCSPGKRVGSKSIALVAVHRRPDGRS